jgi:LysM repeat protein
MDERTWRRSGVGAEVGAWPTQTWARAGRRRNRTGRWPVAIAGAALAGALGAGLLCALPASADTTAVTTAPAVTAVAAASSPGPLRYVVRPGDTLFAIGRAFGVSPAALTAANQLPDPDALAVGQVLVVPLTPAQRGPMRPTVDLSGPDGRSPLPGGPNGDAPMPTTPVPTTPATTTAPPLPAPPLHPAGPGARPLPVALFGAAAHDPARVGLGPLIDHWADAHGLPRSLVRAVAFVESAWRTEARSSVGAIGIGQLLPDTARWVATTLIGDPALDPARAEDNVRMTARYLRYLIDQSGDEDLAIGSYYQGPGSVRRDGLEAETRSYITRVRGAQAHFEALG